MMHSIPVSWGLLGFDVGQIYPYSSGYLIDMIALCKWSKHDEYG